MKTRSAAARLVSDGYVRVNSRRIDNPAKPIVPGDVLTVALERQVRILKVVAAGLRRGPFQEARALFEDMSEAMAPAAENSPATSRRSETGS